MYKITIIFNQIVDLRRVQELFPRVLYLPNSLYYLINLPVNSEIVAL